MKDLLHFLFERNWHLHIDNCMLSNSIGIHLHTLEQDMKPHIDIDCYSKLNFEDTHEILDNLQLKELADTDNFDYLILQNL